MIIESVKGLDIQDIGATTENIEANIDKSSMPFLFEMLSKSLYSNPIESICRELTSNCFDSHIEANVDDPVTVKKGCDEEGYYISFIDVGVGLSPDRIKSIYMNYFSSTKRETNDQIGGFGLGSKSPLSYTDYFHINTVYDKVKYQYIFSKGESIPTLDLLDKSETTDRNGTEIRIYIKNSNDLYKFENALRVQLCYFDNVYFEGWSIDNDYTIFEGTYFKYRNKNDVNTKMHIVLDKVCYPIDWVQLGIKPEYNIAVAVKFRIGELQVTPNREQLRYTDETIALLKDRINKTIDELKTLFYSQNKAFDSFFEWYSKRNEKPYISFNTPDALLYKLYLHGLEDIQKRNTYKYLNGLEDLLSDYSGILDLIYQYLGHTRDTKKRRIYTSSVSRTITDHAPNCYITNVPHRSVAKDWKANDGYIFCKRPITSTIQHNHFVITIDDADRDGIHRDRNPYYFNLGFALRFYKLRKAIIEEVSNRCRKYEDLTPEEELEYKQYRKDNNTTLQKRIEGKVFVDSLSDNYRYDWHLHKPYKDYGRHFAGIDNYTGFVIYGFRENKTDLSKALTLITEIKPKWQCAKSDKIYKVIQINKQNEKYFKNRPNMIHVNNLYGDNKFFRDMASSFKIEYYFKDINQSNGNIKYYIKAFDNINSVVAGYLKELYEFYDAHNSSNGAITREIKEDVLRIAKQYNLYNPKIELIFNHLDDWFKDVEIVRYMPVDNKTLPLILKFLYTNKKKMNIKYYQSVLNTDKSTQLELKFEEPDVLPQTNYKFITQNSIV